MHKLFLTMMALLLTGCVFHHKAYVSEIVLEGKNFRGVTGDEGVFYIDDAPRVSMRMGCYQKTSLGETMFLLIPLPIVDEAEPHDSIASHQFSLIVSHMKNVETELSALDISVEIANRMYPLRFTGKKQIEYHFNYEYMADLRCGDIEEGILEIKLDADKGRAYKVHFEEGVKREINYQPGFVT